MWSTSLLPYVLKLASWTPGSLPQNVQWRILYVLFNFWTLLLNHSVYWHWFSPKLLKIGHLFMWTFFISMTWQINSLDEWHSSWITRLYKDWGKSHGNYFFFQRYQSGGKMWHIQTKRQGVLHVWTLCLQTFHTTHIRLRSVHIYPRNKIVAMTYTPTHV